MRPDHAEFARFFTEEVPFNAHLGMRVLSMGEGEAVMELPAERRFTGDPFRPALHGGVIATLGDNAGGLAVFSLTGPGDRVSTVDLRVDYLRPGRTDVPLRAATRVIRMGNRVAATETTVYHDDPARPVARVAAVYNVVRRAD